MTFNAIILRPRLILSFFVAAGLAFFLPDHLVLWEKALTAWCTGTAVYMVLIASQMTRASEESTRRHASALDDSAWVILLIGMAATAASFGGIAALLYGATTSSGSHLPDITLAACTMVLSWVFMQVVFAVHYTHIYYGDENGVERGGLKFAGDDPPDFWDFVYFTVSIGATAQTSDTGVETRRMRRIVTAQAVYSFFFNTAVLAMAINIGAGLIGH
jgi:uncharacterized membrane protein